LLPPLARSGRRSQAPDLRPADEPITPEAAGTLTGLFRLRVSRTPHALAYRQFENGRWRDYRWHEITAEVARWRAGLAAEGFAIGDRVAMSLPNGVDWVCFDQAALALGLVTVPLYTTDSPGNLAHILADSGARLVLLDSDAPWVALVAQADPLPALQRVLFRRLTGAVPGPAPGSAPSSAQDPRLRALDDWLPAKPTSAATAEMEQTSAKAPSPSASRPGFGSRSGSTSDPTPRSTSHPSSHPSSHPASLASQSEFDSATDPDALATLIYTSGTTGRSKGVMLSHRNILTNAAAVIARIPPRPSDVFLSFLPLAHAFERTVGHYLPMMAGCTIAYARSINQLRDDLMTIRPTVLLSVPRVYDKVYLAIQGKLGSEGVQRRLLDTTVRIGWQRFQANQGRQAPPSLMDQIRWSLLDRLVAAVLVTHAPAAEHGHLKPGPSERAVLQGSPPPLAADQYECSPSLTLPRNVQ
jgi:long-chain acyl-CoA synthetase